MESDNNKNIFDFTRDEASRLINQISEITIRALHKNGLLLKPTKGQMLQMTNAFKTLLAKLDAPKYDPCRLLKKGDRVQVKMRNGRCNGKDGEYLREAFCTVAEDETQNELVRVLHNATEYRLDPAYLELVTPVAEQGSYSVRHNDAHAAYSIYGPYGLSAANYFYGDRYPYSKHSAEAAAYAECDRLNAAYRKESQK